METIKKYGALAVGTHLTFSVGWFAACFLLVKKGVDMKKVVKLLRIP